MLTIGIDIRNIGKKRTGDEVVFFNLVKNLAVIDRENNYHLFTDISEEKVLQKIGKDLGIENRDNFEIKSLVTINKFSWNFWTLPVFLKDNPVDIYLTQYITPFFLSKKVKLITIIHDISFNFFPQFIRKTDLIFLKTLLPLSLSRADKIVGVSKFTQDEIISYYKTDPRKVTWMHNAVSEDYLAQDVSEGRIQAVKEKHHLPSQYILYIGTLQPRKNLPLLIEAYASAKNVLSGVKLVLAGGKGHNYDKQIDEAIEKYELGSDVILPGYIAEEDKAALVKGAQVFCLPSLYEGFGIPMLEAMSVGTPVTASDIPSQREIAGEAALFFQPNDPAQLAENLKILANDSEKRAEFIARGKERVLDFSWQSSAEKMLAIFREL